MSCTTRVLTAILLCLALATRFTNADPAPPSPATFPRALHQVQRRELQVRANYPEFFVPRDDTSPTGSDDDDDDDCANSARRRRRDFYEWSDQLLSVDEIVDFLLGGGGFTSANGTSYHDPEFIKEHERAYKAYGPYSTLRRWVTNSFGERIMYLTLPAYQAWKNNVDPESVVYLTSRTGFRAKDLPEIERALLGHAEFTELKVSGAHITRRWLEAAIKYSD
ncbi:uncharacterized protein C8R40DRAFT_1175809 [Lentinula edodes]|uniref:uncharacterized protein n=1 Tax=Lentinula edodes TaxID=5353 RepID=UPI001E8D12DD|nr:uncharacterized protein C8R40DRAFT_1175809 [Lentinula edodes]KAH7870331.1 hypothetical protein C8R40DRAFT_1175809 [Lentinula edodes]